MAQFNRATSQYINTPVKDFYLDIWDPIDIPESTSDEKIMIETKHHKRPDLLSFEVYGTPRLWWIFAVRNIDILIDPIEDFVAGTIIFVPSESSIEGLL